MLSYNNTEKNKEKNILFLINPKSGEQEGRILLNLEKDYYEFPNKPSEENEELIIKSFIFNVIDGNSFSKAKELINSLSNQLKESRIIIGGGDGSVLSIIEELILDEVNLSSCVFGVLPLGTGNDLSNTMGFGGSMEINSLLSTYKNICELYSNAERTYIDIWQVKLVLDKTEGMIIQNGSYGQKRQKKLNVFFKSFINYFSLGYDARVGFSFEKSRSSSRFCNKFIYFWEGLKKQLCRKTIRVKGFLKSFQSMRLNKNLSKISNDDSNSRLIKKSSSKKILEEIINNDDHVNRKESMSNEYKIIKDENYYYSDADICLLNKKIRSNSIHTDNYDKIDLFLIDNPDEKSYTLDNRVYLKGDPVSIIGQNINYYMGGSSDIWYKSGDSIGVEYKESEEGNESDSVLNKTVGIDKTQSYNDGKLEFFTYENGFTIGLEKVLRSGLADKIYQGEGPILITFKETPSYNKDDKENRIYLNLDGEYFNIVKPVSLRIRLNEKIFNGKIPFLKRKI